MAAILEYDFAGGAHSAIDALSLQSLDAANGEVLPYRFVQATPGEVDAAAEAAASVYPHYRQLPISRRTEFLDTIAVELDTSDADFTAVVCREIALPATRIQDRRSRTSSQLRLFAEALRRDGFHGTCINRARPECKPLLRVDPRQCRIGLGPVAVFGVSNFPLTFPAASGNAAVALAAGYPMVFKAHSGHIVTAEQVAAAIPHAAERTGIPAGVSNMIYGNGVGEWLARHLTIQAVGLIGSLKGGRTLCDMTVTRVQPIPVFVEMNSTNPVVLLPVALKKRGEAVANEPGAPVMLSYGQLCTNPGLVIGICSAQFLAFLERFAVRMGNQPTQTMFDAGMLANYERGPAALHAHPRVHHLTGRPQGGRQARP